jgi:ribosomal protein L24E
MSLCFPLIDPRIALLLGRVALCFGVLVSHVVAADSAVRVSTVAQNGMPRDIVPRQSDWNFGPGSLWTHKGWQYAAYWDDACQVSVARRKLPDGQWAVASLPGYKRTESGDRGKGGAISRGFGDGHEKVAMGISPDGFIHLSFDHHLSTLRYRTSKVPVAADPESHEWSADLFGPVRDNLGGPEITSVTYPSFISDGRQFLLYLRLGGGSGSANSHLFTYENGKWTVNNEKESQIIDLNWSGGDRSVNAYPFGLEIKDGRCHLTWCWRDTPDPRTCHDLCYAYSDDFGQTWKNNQGAIIGERGRKFITADSPGVSVWPFPTGTRYVNGGSMAVGTDGAVLVLVSGEDGSPVILWRNPQNAVWTRHSVPSEGHLTAIADERFHVLTNGRLFMFGSSKPEAWSTVGELPRELFADSKPGRDSYRPHHDGWISAIGQQGRKISVVDVRLPGDK